MKQPANVLSGAVRRRVKVTMPFRTFKTAAVLLPVAELTPRLRPTYEVGHCPDLDTVIGTYCFAYVRHSCLALLPF